MSVSDRSADSQLDTVDWVLGVDERLYLYAPQRPQAWLMSDAHVDAEVNR